jgi:hypothetical protein
VGVTQLVIRTLFEFGLFILPGEAAGAHRAQVRQLLLEGLNLLLNPLLFLSVRHG